MSPRRDPPRRRALAVGAVIVVLGWAHAAADPPDPWPTVTAAVDAATATAYGALAEVAAKLGTCTATSKHATIDGPNARVEPNPYIPGLANFVFTASTAASVGKDCGPGVRAVVELIDESPLPGQNRYNPGPITKADDTLRKITSTGTLSVPYYSASGVRQVSRLTVRFEAWHREGSPLRYVRYFCEDHVYHVIATPNGPVLVDPGPLPTPAPLPSPLPAGPDTCTR